MKRVIRIFVLCWSILLTAAGDVPVTCVLTSDCVLPCRSPYYKIIHWYKDGKNDPVHTFYNNADHLQYQDAAFKGRTSLFNDQISGGNVSLLLRTINFKDEGRYKCYTATDSQNKEQFVLLKVQVPIKLVDLQMTSEGISCSTNDVYPKPQISWYSDGGALSRFTVNITGDKEGLFSVSSVLSLSVKENTTYTCSISLGDESQSYTASLRKENVGIYSGQNGTLHCPVSQEITENNTITLRFGESLTVLRGRGSTGQLRGKTVNRSDDVTVTIHNLEDSGTYTCERVTARSRQLVITSVQIHSADQRISEGGKTAAIVISVIGVIIVIGIIAGVMVHKKIKEQQQSKKEDTECETKYKVISEQSGNGIRTYKENNDVKDTSQEETTEETPLD